MELEGLIAVCTLPTQLPASYFLGAAYVLDVDFTLEEGTGVGHEEAERLIAKGRTLTL